MLSFSRAPLRFFRLFSNELVALENLSTRSFIELVVSELSPGTVSVQNHWAPFNSSFSAFRLPDFHLALVSSHCKKCMNTSLSLMTGCELFVSLQFEKKL